MCFICFRRRQCEVTKKVKLKVEKLEYEKKIIQFIFSDMVNN